MRLDAPALLAAIATIAGASPTFWHAQSHPQVETGTTGTKAGSKYFRMSISLNLGLK